MSQHHNTGNRRWRGNRHQSFSSQTETYQSDFGPPSGHRPIRQDRANHYNRESEYNVQPEDPLWGSGPSPYFVEPEMMRRNDPPNQGVGPPHFGFHERNKHVGWGQPDIVPTRGKDNSYPREISQPFHSSVNHGPNAAMPQQWREPYPDPGNQWRDREHGFHPDFERSQPARHPMEWESMPNAAWADHPPAMGPPGIIQPHHQHQKGWSYSEGWQDGPNHRPRHQPRHHDNRHSPIQNRRGQAYHSFRHSENYQNPRPGYWNKQGHHYSNQRRFGDDDPHDHKNFEQNPKLAYTRKTEKRRHSRSKSPDSQYGRRRSQSPKRRRRETPPPSSKNTHDHRSRSRESRYSYSHRGERSSKRKRDNDSDRHDSSHSRDKRNYGKRGRYEEDEERGRRHGEGTKSNGHRDRSSSRSRTRSRSLSSRSRTRSLTRSLSRSASRSRSRSRGRSRTRSRSRSSTPRSRSRGGSRSSSRSRVGRHHNKRQHTARRSDSNSRSRSPSGLQSQTPSKPKSIASKHRLPAKSVPKLPLLEDVPLATSRAVLPPAQDQTTRSDSLDSRSRSRGPPTGPRAAGAARADGSSTSKPHSSLSQFFPDAGPNRGASVSKDISDQHMSSGPTPTGPAEKNRPRMVPIGENRAKPNKLSEESTSKSKENEMPPPAPPAAIPASLPSHSSKPPALPPLVTESEKTEVFLPRPPRSASPPKTTVANPLPHPPRPASPTKSALATPIPPETPAQATPTRSTKSEELYKILTQVGEGTFGKVYKARNQVNGTHVALKRIRMEGERDGFPVTAMREIKLLQSLKHENVVTLYEMMVSKGLVFMVFEYVHHDLSGVLQQTQLPLQPQHLKSLIYGPEVDMWSAGCIFLELFVKKQIFQGSDEIHQLDVIFRIMGSPTTAQWPSLPNLPWYELVKPTTTMNSIFQHTFKKWVPPGALAIAEQMLAFDPEQRITAADAVLHPYFTTEEPALELPDLSQLDGEWHELEAKRARRKRRPEHEGEGAELPSNQC
ncbi:kinase subunit of RNA polymerase II carboxy-terminal domain kinase I [Serendipita sp. 396]|nr:kinase subunit of RNA polymerase II carboxy-terminal domain kinase I [Serendipita sp. 396]